MAVKLGSSDSEDLAELADINVTPFIDVALVLLIIFMVAAPLSTVDVPVDLPMSNATPEPRPHDPVFLTLTRELSLKLGEATVTRDMLGGELDAATKSDRGQRVFLRADAGVAYGELMAVMNLLRRAGYLKIALVGLEDAGTSPAKPDAPSP